MGGGLCLFAGYDVTNGGPVKTFSLWFDKALRYFELLPSAYPSDARLSAPSATLNEATRGISSRLSERGRWVVR